MFAGIMQQMLCWGLIMTFGSILAYYTDYLLPGRAKWRLTLVGTIPPFFLLSSALFWGRLLDAGYHRTLNSIAAVFLTVGLAALTFTGGNGESGDGKYWAILLAAIPIGIGQSIYFLGAPHMAKTWFPCHKGAAMNITNTGAAVGGVLWPLVFTKVTNNVNFKAGIGDLGLGALIMSIFITWASTPAPDFAPRSIGKLQEFSTWIPTMAFKSRTYLLHIMAMCFIYLGILTTPFIIEVWAQRNHLGRAEGVDERGHAIHFEGDNCLTVYIVIAMNAFQLPGRLLGSFFCDYLKARKVHATACFASIVTVGFGWNYTSDCIEACIFASVFGLLLGTMVSLPINDVQELLGQDRIHLLGQLASAVYTCASPFILAGGIISGALVDRFHVKYAWIWPCCTFGLGLILIMTSLVAKDDTWKFENDDLGQRGGCLSITHTEQKNVSENVVIDGPEIAPRFLDEAIIRACY